MLLCLIWGRLFLTTFVVSVLDYECAIDSKDQPVAMTHPQIDDIAERFVLLFYCFRVPVKCQVLMVN